MPFPDLAFYPSKQPKCVRKCGIHGKTVVVFPPYAGLERMLAGKVRLSVRNVGERVGVFTSPVSNHRSFRLSSDVSSNPILCALNYFYEPCVRPFWRFLHAYPHPPSFASHSPCSVGLYCRF